MNDNQLMGLAAKAVGAIVTVAIVLVVAVPIFMGLW